MATKKNIFSTRNKNVSYLMHNTLPLVMQVYPSGRQYEGGRFTTVYEIRNALAYYSDIVRYGRSDFKPTITVYTRYTKEEFGITVSSHSGRLSFGCNVFSATTVRRMAKWAGIKLPKRQDTTMSVRAAA